MLLKLMEMAHDHIGLLGRWTAQFSSECDVDVVVTVILTPVIW